VDDRTKKVSGVAGQHRVLLPEQAIRTALREEPLLRGLLAVGAGYLARASTRPFLQPPSLGQAMLAYCVKGGGWCELSGRLQPVRAGEVLVLPPGVPQRYGTHRSAPWTVHWVAVAGDDLSAYLSKLPGAARGQLVWMGEHLELTRLFNEVRLALARGTSFPDLLYASHALGQLLAVLIGHGDERRHGSSDSVEKVAQAIIYMSERLDEPLRVSALSALANLSPAHFGALFKRQTGCAPREYLHLLRIHRACQLLRSTSLSVKEVATRLGYQDQFHFSRQFKAFEGLSPTDYRGSRAAGAR
jgi:AraC family transcriptional regulator, arabinose operon regulatory protein